MRSSLQHMHRTGRSYTCSKMVEREDKNNMDKARSTQRSPEPTFNRQTNSQMVAKRRPRQRASSRKIQKEKQSAETKAGRLRVPGNCEWEIQYTCEWTYSIWENCTDRETCS